MEVKDTNFVATVNVSTMQLFFEGQYIESDCISKKQTKVCVLPHE